GGAYLSCATLGPLNDASYYLQRFTGAGTIAPGWPEGGAAVCTAPGDRAAIRMAPDGAGGVYLAWADHRDVLSSDAMYVQRMGPDGTPYPGWPGDGVRVTVNQGFDDYPYLAPDGSGGVYLCWVQCCFTPPADDHVLVQHLTGGGAVAPGWPANGMTIPSQYSNDLPHITADGFGGAIVVWESSTGDARALRFVADGPTHVQVALVSAEAAPNLVRLRWYSAAPAGVEFTVYRRSATADWQRLDQVLGDNTGAIRYEDRAVTPG